MQAFLTDTFIFSCEPEGKLTGVNELNGIETKVALLNPPLPTVTLSTCPELTNVLSLYTSANRSNLTPTLAMVLLSQTWAGLRDVICGNTVTVVVMLLANGQREGKLDKDCYHKGKSLREYQLMRRLLCP